MTSLFGLCVVVGFLWLFVEHAARMNSPAPSMGRESGNGWILIMVGVIGALCVSYLP